MAWSVGDANLLASCGIFVVLYLTMCISMNMFVYVGDDNVVKIWKFVDEAN